MAGKFIQLWESYLEDFKLLSDAEVGRLIRAMMKYKSDGTEPKLSGNERFIWPAFKRDMETSNDKYEKKSKAGQASAIRKQNREITDNVSVEKCSEQNPTEANTVEKCSEQNSTEANIVDVCCAKEKEKVKVKEKDNISFEPRRSAAEDICPFFEKLWEEYPRKRGKNRVSKKSLARINKVGYRDMHRAIMAYREEVEGKREEYIMHGSTFFNGRYADYLAEAKKNAEIGEDDYLYRAMSHIPVFEEERE